MYVLFLKFVKKKVKKILLVIKNTLNFYLKSLYLIQVKGLYTGKEMSSF